MTQANFMEWAKKTVLAYTLSHTDPTSDLDITEDDVYIVWYCKTLQNHKALLCTALFDKMYYEFTYNGDRDEAYLDAYCKITNEVIKHE